MTDASEEIRRDSNWVAGFLEECCWYKIRTGGYRCRTSAWRSPHGFCKTRARIDQCRSNETIGKALLATSDSKIAIGEDLRDGKRRYHAGIVLNEEGLAFHQSGYENRDLQGKTANATEPRGTINSVMPPQWLEKQSIKAMRKACDGLM